MQALADALLPEGRAAMEPLLDLVAVATVADIMPLIGENRRLVIAGLRIMNAFPRPGVRALIETSGLKPGEVDAAEAVLQGDEPAADSWQRSQRGWRWHEPPGSSSGT